MAHQILHSTVHGLHVDARNLGQACACMQGAVLVTHICMYICIYIYGIVSGQGRVLGLACGSVRYVIDQQICWGSLVLVCVALGFGMAGVAEVLLVWQKCHWSSRCAVVAFTPQQMWC